MDHSYSINKEKEKEYIEMIKYCKTVIRELLVNEADVEDFQLMQRRLFKTHLDYVPVDLSHAGINHFLNYIIEKKYSLKNIRYFLEVSDEMRAWCDVLFFNTGRHYINYWITNQRIISKEKLDYYCRTAIRDFLKNERKHLLCWKPDRGLADFNIMQANLKKKDCRYTIVDLENDENIDDFIECLISNVNTLQDLQSIILTGIAQDTKAFISYFFDVEYFCEYLSDGGLVTISDIV